MTSVGKLKISKSKYSALIKNIGLSIDNARQVALKTVNAELVKANWEIGRHLVQFEQQGNERAEYGSALLTKLSADLQKIHGKGFGRRNLLDMRRFYLCYQKWQTVSAKLSWSHYVALLSITNDIGRAFYQKQCLIENWSMRELERQINASLFERLALSKNKKQILQLSKKGNVAGDAEPIGIILSAEKDEVLVEYATGGLSNKIFVSKDQLHMPDQKVLEKRVKEILHNN